MSWQTNIFIKSFPNGADKEINERLKKNEPISLHTLNDGKPVFVWLENRNDKLWIFNIPSKYRVMMAVLSCLDEVDVYNGIFGRKGDNLPVCYVVEKPLDYNDLRAAISPEQKARLAKLNLKLSWFSDPEFIRLFRASVFKYYNDGQDKDQYENDRWEYANEFDLEHEIPKAYTKFFDDKTAGVIFDHIPQTSIYPVEGDYVIDLKTGKLVWCGDMSEGHFDGLYITSESRKSVKALETVIDSEENVANFEKFLAEYLPGLELDVKAKNQSKLK